MKSRIMAILTIMFLAFIPLMASAIEYPTIHAFVTDNANIISSDYEQKITRLAQEIHKNTTVEVAVLTIDTLNGDTIEDYAVKTFEKNGIGKNDKDNGLLIIVAKQEREYRFEVGYGLEGTIPDSMKVTIGDRIIVPNFKNGDYGKGIYESMLVINGLVTKNPEVVSKYSSNSTSTTNDPIGFAIFFTAIIIVIIVIRKSNGGRGGGGHSGGSSGGSYSGGSSHSSDGYSGGGGSSGGGGFGGKY
ncbi:MAG: TPM domain-containing protein [Candidatus Methanoperedens sp.]|nr:TPM domain-containing protein [Candidatus Methanoperedens sp.]MCE8429182.1 TPM domain-containing protein [Candidatus Methanoperedens sp.]